MIRAVSFHAIQRLQERRNCEHLLRHLNKVQKWNLPANGELIHKGWRYITADGILITVIPDRKTIKAHRESLKKEKSE